MRKAVLGALLLATCSFASFAQINRDEDEGATGDRALPSGIHMNEGGKAKTVKLRVLAISPLQFTDNGVGFSVSYEHSLDPTGIVTYILPVAATFDMTNTSYTNSMYYFMPGLKFYPTSWKGKVKYAIGPSVLLGAGERHEYDEAVMPLYSSYYYNVEQQGSKYQLGVMVNNYLNFQPTAHLYMGLEFGFGFTYLNQFMGHNQGVDGLVQGCFKIGYNF
jgi:hypothetical protein